MKFQGVEGGTSDEERADMLNAIRNEAAVEVSGDEPAVASAPSKAASDSENQVKRMFAMRPGLAAAIPAEHQSDDSKLMYVMTHHALAAQVKGVVFTMPAGTSGSITLKANGELEVVERPGKKFTLNNKHDDLARLLEGSGVGYEAVRTSEPGALLAKAVAQYYSDSRYDGGAENKNTRGQNTFAYRTTDQGLTSTDPSAVSLECIAAADFHLYKSMGLIPPGLERAEVEHRYTSIHGDSGGVRLGREFDKSVRGIPGGKPFSPNEAVAFANALRNDDWAKLTGASSGTYALKRFASIGAVTSHFENGGSAVHAGWANGGHHFVVSAAVPVANGVFVNQDDSLKSSRNEAPGDHWSYPTPYHPEMHSNFWAIVR